MQDEYYLNSIRTEISILIFNSSVCTVDSWKWYCSWSIMKVINILCTVLNCLIAGKMGLFFFFFLSLGSLFHESSVRPFYEWHLNFMNELVHNPVNSRGFLPLGHGQVLSRDTFAAGLRKTLMIRDAPSRLFLSWWRQIPKIRFLRQHWILIQYCALLQYAFFSANTYNRQLPASYDQRQITDNFKFWGYWKEVSNLYFIHTWG